MESVQGIFTYISTKTRVTFQNADLNLSITSLLTDPDSTKLYSCISSALLIYSVQKCTLIIFLHFFKVFPVGWNLLHYECNNVENTNENMLTVEKQSTFSGEKSFKKEVPSIITLHKYHHLFKIIRKHMRHVSKILNFIVCLNCSIMYSPHL